MVVKVEIETRAPQARIRSQDRVIDMRVPTQQVQRRMPGLSIAFFQAELADGGVLELGERAKDENW